MKISRRKEYLYINGYNIGVKQRFSDIKKVFVAPCSNERYKNTFDLVVVFPCTFTREYSEHRYRVPMGNAQASQAQATKYKELIEQFISEWQAKQ